MKLSSRLTNSIAAGFLMLMFCLAFFSMKDIPATTDEVPHISAGYSYLSQKDFRLNPEHPPLIKDLAALPLLSQNLNFPENYPSWLQGVNQQWWFGNQFLYQSGNDADKIIFSSRIPMILILLLLGWLIFHWARKLGGNFVGLAVLFLFTLSPTFLAHGRLVTTDVGAALGIVLATLFYLRFLKNPKKLNIILAGLTLGIALLLKFSCILLLPLFVVITLVYVFLFPEKKEAKKVSKNLLKYLGLALLILVIAALVIWLVYLFHTWNYPIEKQVEDTKSLLSSNPLVKINLWLAQSKIFRPLGHYLLGLSMATQRVAGGNTIYFLGNVSNIAWWYYFPVVYFLKVPLAFHILTILAILLAFLSVSISRLKSWCKNHFTELTMLIFLAIYWTTSIKGNLNIGVRHILPIFPFTYILVCLAIKNGYQKLKSIPLRKTIVIVSLILFSWYGFSSLKAFPHYLSYFNETAGGSSQGYKLVVDSNYDWGQDLKWLKNWLEENKVEKIYVDYFGGGDIPYYLGEKYLHWQGTKSPNEFPKGNYLAVSATLLKGGQGIPVKDFNQPTTYYNWLNSYAPVARAGNSIFIYYID